MYCLLGQRDFSNPRTNWTCQLAKQGLTWPLFQDDSGFRFRPSQTEEVRTEDAVAGHLYVHLDPLVLQDRCVYAILNTKVYLPWLRPLCNCCALLSGGSSNSSAAVLLCARWGGWGCHGLGEENSLHTTSTHTMEMLSSASMTPQWSILLLSLAWKHDRSPLKPVHCGSQ